MHSNNKSWILQYIRKSWNSTIFQNAYIFAMGRGDSQAELAINQFDTYEGSREGI